MPVLSYERYLAEIVAQTELLALCIEGANLNVPVPSCPGWNVGQLARHLGGAQLGAAETVRIRATQSLPDDSYRDLSGYAHEDPAVVGPWLRQCAGQLAEVLRESGPDAQVWTPVPVGTARFYARRFTHEAVIHRADAMLALGANYVLDETVAIDAMDEWLELGSLPMHLDIHPWLRELFGPGRTLHLHATGAGTVGAEWMIDLTGETILTRRGHEKAAVAVRGSLTDLLLLMYRRRPARGDGIEILGDAALLDFWLERVSFG